MAIVLTRKYGNATVHVCDDEYINCTPEEHEARVRDMFSVVRQIISKPENRRRLEEMYRRQDAEAAALLAQART